MPGDKATYTDWAQCTGADFKNKLFEVEVSELIFGGGIAVDDYFESTVTNFFCGSVFFFCFNAWICSVSTSCRNIFR